MKKSYIVLTIIGIIAILIILIFVLGKINSNKDQNEQMMEDIGDVENIELLNTTHVVITSSSDIKTTPNTVFVFKTYYDKCMHVTIRKNKPSEEFVNKSEEQIQVFYEDWKIEEFSKDKVVFYRELEGICNEHYIIKDIDGYLNVFIIDENNVETLFQTTDIVTMYLPDEDKELLKEGIRVIGKDNLNRAIEDYE